MEIVGVQNATNVIKELIFKIQIKEYYKMDKAKYGERIYGYSESTSTKGHILNKFWHDFGKNHNYILGKIKSSETFYQGPIKINVWYLENGKIYHYY